MGYADRAPKHSGDVEHHRVPRSVPILGSIDRHLAAVLASARQVLMASGLGVEAIQVVHLRLAGETGGCKTTDHRLEPQMNVHNNARLTPPGRLLMGRRIEEEGWKVADAASAAGLAVRRAYPWLGAFRGA